MRSKITIEVDFDLGTPFIKVVSERHSSDLKDNAIQAFFEKLNHNRWASVLLQGQGGDMTTGRFDVWGIYPIQPKQIPEEYKLMGAMLNISPEEGVLYQQAHEHLDHLGVPRCDSHLGEYSFAGRIYELIRMVETGKITHAAQNPI